MKLVVNKCYGGFSLSVKAVCEYAKRKGKTCYVFENEYKSGRYVPYTGQRAFLISFFTIPNPNDILKQDKPWILMSDKEKEEHNKKFEEVYISNRDVVRHDPDLVAVVEKLGVKANGECAELEVVEIPDGIEYEISDYDGMETIHETHRSW